ncbi:MAG: YkgJ family cysteine cluster protein [Sandaracinaceae bacterium]
MREVQHRYDDPLDRVWIATAEAIGLRVTRTPDAYATTDGRGALAIGVSGTLDADDHLAQMILHELCHSLVEGPDSFERADWGLDNESERDLRREHACLRTQAWLTQRHGLRGFFAPTTDHRAFFDALGDDPLEGDDPSVRLARRAIARAERDPWAPHLARALDATEAMIRTAAAFAPRGSDRSLYATLAPARPIHPAGGRVHPAVRGRTCGECAWASGDDLACAARAHARIEARWPICERFAARVECDDCGACCREAYGEVAVEEREPITLARPDLVRAVSGGLAILRGSDGRCPALLGDGGAAPYRCEAYEARPRSCRDFERGGDHCFEARRRVGLSP